jgi:hypothetical protein
MAVLFGLSSKWLPWSTKNGVLTNFVSQPAVREPDIAPKPELCRRFSPGRAGFQNSLRLATRLEATIKANIKGQRIKRL